ncbi:MAG: glycosyltransferase family 9 protein [Melioribacteraceae bacterium]|nr:glycosyltransferase family 9 protein [Melioribacteraceae bacterium]MCF8352873.1 glycosyltransferase family 9 protein [Melioribacteraceae bacterium]MCF8393810.1 glycosyltransferase family 9 protein [Melioribacteraceae bacterium]MCF8417390.1 glycosyltransferase family 9 protein [Melioribacteraceae bacterium]
MKFKPEEIKKILLIKPRGIGDVILSTIVLDNLKGYFQNVLIDYLTEPYAVTAVEFLPQVNKVLTMKKSEFFLMAVCSVRKEKYDMIIDMWSNPRTAQITFFSGVKYRVGYAYRGRSYAYNIKATSERGTTHTAEHNLELLNALSIPIISKNIHYKVEDISFIKAKEFIAHIFGANQKIVGIIPAGGWASKRVDAVKWVDIVHDLLKNYNCKVLVLWGPGDEDDANFIVENIPNDSALIPKTSFQEMTGYIKNCDLIIANDSGPMHAAAAIGIPTLGIFGPTDGNYHGPYADNSDFVANNGLHCLKCNKFDCPYNHECMLELPNEKILAKIDQIAGEILRS